jgi:hypothetical protein
MPPCLKISASRQSPVEPSPTSFEPHDRLGAEASDLGLHRDGLAHAGIGRSAKSHNGDPRTNEKTFEARGANRGSEHGRRSRWRLSRRRPSQLRARTGATTGSTGFRDSFAAVDETTCVQKLPASGAQSAWPTKAVQLDRQATDAPHFARLGFAGLPASPEVSRGPDLPDRQVRPRPDLAFDTAALVVAEVGDRMSERRPVHGFRYSRIAGAPWSQSSASTLRPLRASDQLLKPRLRPRAVSP